MNKLIISLLVVLSVIFMGNVAYSYYEKGILEDVIVREKMSGDDLSVFTYEDNFAKCYISKSTSYVGVAGGTSVAISCIKK